MMASSGAPCCASGGAAVGAGFLVWTRVGWILDVDDAIVIDRRQGAEEKAVDVSEDGGAARGDAVLRDEVEEIAKSEIDALGSPEILRVFEEKGLEVFLAGLVGRGAVARAGGGVRGDDWGYFFSAVSESSGFCAVLAG